MEKPSKETEAKIERLIQTSKEVILDCSLDNGGIVAANSTKASYPEGVQNYFYVWPRDAAFACIAADTLGLHNVPEKFFDWCQKRAIDKNGLLWHRYEPNGVRSGFIISEWYNVDLAIGPKYVQTPHGIKIENYLGQFTKYVHPDGTYASGFARSQLQPDQNALVLWAIKEHSQFNKQVSKDHKQLIEKLTDGICSLWNKDKNTYRYLYHDPWEEKIGFPGINITYDVATDILGLNSALKLTDQPKQEWRETLSSMQKALENSHDRQNKLWKAVSGSDFQKESYKKVFTDNLVNQDLFNPEIDISLLSLIYPTSLINKEEGKVLVDTLIKNLRRGNGLIRYPGDKFEGQRLLEKYGEERKGNIWPFFNFWTSIALSKLGFKEESYKYYSWAIQDTKDYIPEQIDENGNYKGASPLCWAHSMFVLASKELGFLS